MSSGGEDELSRWPPRPQVCLITAQLLCEVSGLPAPSTPSLSSSSSSSSSSSHREAEDSALEQRLAGLTALDLHLRDGNKGKIRRIEQLHRVPNLTQLNLSYNALHRIEGLEFVPFLVELNLAENAITKIEGIFHLRQLERLNLCGNAIERIPSSITALKKLHSIRLNRNCLSDLQDLNHFGNMHSLRNLRIDNNLFPEPSGISLREMILQSVTPALEVLNNEPVATTPDRSKLSSEKLHTQKYSPHHTPVPRDEHLTDSDSSPRPMKSRVLAIGQGNVNVGLLQQRLITEQRRAELLEEEAQQARKHFQQLNASAERRSTPQEKAASKRELDLIARVHAEKSNEATEAKALVSQLQQELTFQEIDNSFDEWGAVSSRRSSSDSSSTSSDDSSTKNFRNIYSQSSILVKDKQEPMSGHYGYNDATPGGEQRSTAESGLASEDSLHHQFSHKETMIQPFSQQGSGMGQRVSDLTSQLHLLSTKLKQTEREKMELQDSLKSCRTRLQNAEDEVKRSRSRVMELEVSKEQNMKDIQVLTHKVSKLQSRSASVAEATPKSKLIFDEAEYRDEIVELRNEVKRWQEACSDREMETISVKQQLEKLMVEKNALRMASAEIDMKSMANKATPETLIVEKKVTDYEIESKILQKTVEDLHDQLEEAQRDGSLSRENIIKLQKDNVALRTSLQEFVKCEDSTIDAEKLLSTLKSQLAAKDSYIKQMEEETIYLKGSLKANRDELETYLRNSNKNTNSKISTSEAAKSIVKGAVERNIDQATKIANMKTKSISAENYFDETESSIEIISDNDQSLSPMDALESKPSSKSGGNRATFFNGVHIHAMADGLSGHETAAAHSLASAILEELKTAFDSSPVSPSNLPVTQLKRACVKAALRLICSAGNSLRSSHHHSSAENVKNDTKNVVLPLDVFGEAKVISQLVADGQAALELLDDTKHLRLEKLQTERVLEDLNEQLKGMETKRIQKIDAINALSTQCDETKRHAQVTLSDLNAVMENLKAGRKNVLDQDHQLAIKRNEIEAANAEFEEINNLSQMEHKNIDAVRLRLKSLHKEKAECESRLAEVRQKFSLEESRFRNAKSVGTTEIRGLHEELVKVQNLLKQTQKDLEKSRKEYELLEVKKEQSQQESHQEHVHRLRTVDEDNRVLSSLQEEIRKLRIEIQSLEKKKQQVRSEITSAEEKVILLHKKGEHDIQETTKRINEMDIEFRASKDKAGEMENEQAVLNLVIEDLKRQQSDIEKSNNNKKRELEEEIQALQVSVNAANRSIRLTTIAGDQKRDEADSLLSEIRSWERKLEDLKRVCREQEISHDAQKEVLCSLNMEQDKVRKELAQNKREDEDLRHQKLLMRSSIDQESRAIDDLRRSIRNLQDEESEWKDRMTRSKAAYNQTKASAEETQSEADLVRANSERERRDLIEIRSKKSMVEAEVARNEEELKYIQEQIRDEENRRSSYTMEAKKNQEEVLRWQKDLLDIQRRCTEGRKQEEEVRRKENEASLLKDRVKAELESLMSILSAEQRNMDALRNEKAVLLSESKHVQQEFHHNQKELHTLASTLEATKAQLTHMDSVKENLQSEISRLQGTANLEIARAERVSESHKDLERRLRDLRTDLAREESAYERVKCRNADEEEKYSQRRRALHAANEELSKIEANLAESNELIHSQRNKAIEEISQLDLIKQSVRNDVLLLSDSKKRHDRLHQKDGDQIVSRLIPGSGQPSHSIFDQRGNFVHDRLRSAMSLEKQGNNPTLQVFDSPGRTQLDDPGDVSREIDEAVFRSLQEAHDENSRLRDPFLEASLPTPQFNETNLDKQRSVLGDSTPIEKQDQNVADLRSEMQKLRDQASAVLST